MSDLLSQYQKCVESYNAVADGTDTKTNQRAAGQRAGFVRRINVLVAELFGEGYTPGESNDADAQTFVMFVPRATSAKTGGKFGNMTDADVSNYLDKWSRAFVAVPVAFESPRAAASRNIDSAIGELRSRNVEVTQKSGSPLASAVKSGYTVPTA